MKWNSKYSIDFQDFQIDKYMMLSEKLVSCNITLNKNRHWSKITSSFVAISIQISIFVERLHSDFFYKKYGFKNPKINKLFT